MVTPRCLDADSAAWKIGKVELASDLVADGYIPGWNCTVAAWSLREPSLALGLDGLPRAAYRADDISGGFNPNPDPHYPPCSANLDMTLTRYAQLGSLDR